MTQETRHFYSEVEVKAEAEVEIVVQSYEGMAIDPLV